MKYDCFENEVKMYVYEEMINGRKLTEIINTEHENVKYLPGYKLPENVIAEPDIAKAVENADILIFVLPHQFIRRICESIKGKVKKSAIGISLIKGFLIEKAKSDSGKHVAPPEIEEDESLQPDPCEEESALETETYALPKPKTKGNELVKSGMAEGKGLDVGDCGLRLISTVIKEILDIECNVLMGANLAPEVADENYCEATIGCKEPQTGAILKKAFQADYFRIVVVKDVVAVELCGALKNVVALGAGIADGLGYGDNTKAAVIRLGLMEMIAFIEKYFKGTDRDTFLESCGVADLVTTCYGGRNRKVAEAMVKSNKTIEQLEVEMLNGQSLQGPPTAAEINVMLKEENVEDRFPLFTAIHRICIGDLPCTEFVNCLKNHPEHIHPSIKGTLPHDDPRFQNAE